MKKPRLWLLLFIVCLGSLLQAQDIYLSGLNEMTYIYRTAPDSLNSYFRDAFSFALGYKDFTMGAKFLAELPKYSTEQSQLQGELDPNRLTDKWTERYIEYAKDDLFIHAGTISESFGSGMIFRAWEDLEFDQDTRIDGFLVKFDRKLKLKALYAALPNNNQPTKTDLVYGADASLPIWFIKNIQLGASALTLRTLTPLNTYNQQDVFGGRVSASYEKWDAGAEYAVTSLHKNGAGNREGKGINAFTNFYLKPGFLASMSLGAVYKYYDNFEYRLQDLKTANYHNETLADNLVSGTDEEGIQGIVAITPVEGITFNANYAEGWNASYTKRMNDIYTNLEWQLGDKTLLAEYGHTEKLDKETDHWQKDLKPAINFSMPLGNKSLTTKFEYQYIQKVNHDESEWHYEPMLQVDLGLGKLSISTQAESFWKDGSDLTGGRYWANVEAKYGLFEHTDVTLFVGKQAGGKVCRNGICRYVAPFQGVKLEAVTRF